jgi:Zn-dependent protease/predicted transcriptional regulator
MKSSIKIGKILDIPIKIHFTFIFILALFAWAFSLETISIFGFRIGFGGLPISSSFQLILGVFTAIFLFICVLLHELGHSYVTQKLGYKINSITLFIFGGISNSEEIPRNPKQEIKIAIAGPLVSLALGLSFFVLYYFTRTYNNSLLSNIILINLGSLSFYNLILAGFNLIPAFPIDGGRVLRALFAMKMNYQKATKIAANIGKGVAVIMAIIGIFFNFWLILIAIFVYIGASQEEKTLRVSLALEDKKVKDIMKKDFESVSPDMNLKDLYEKIRSQRHLGFPVISDEKIIGTVSLDDIKSVKKDNWQQTNVKDIMNKDFSTVSSDENAFSVFKRLIKSNLDRLVVKEDNEVVGIISINDLSQEIQISGVKNE